MLDSRAALTFAQLPPLIEAQLRERDLADLRAAGPLGELLARQAVVYAADHDRAALAAAHPALPADLLNFHWDPVTVCRRRRLDGAVIEEVGLGVELDGTALRLRRDDGGRPTRIVTAIDAEGFDVLWRHTLLR